MTNPKDPTGLIVGIIVTLICIVILWFTTLYLKEIQNQDQRQEYIEVNHSEIIS